MIGRVREATGCADACPVMAEDFRQWVIEDDFAAGRPQLERVGVAFVQDVAPYEEAKIRMLNASHSAIAWAGVLKGYRFIHEGAADDAILAVARSYLNEGVIPSLAPSPIDLALYGRTTLERFANAELADTNQRVAADSWAKLSGFVAPTLKARLVAGAKLDAVALPPALFLHVMQQWAAGQLPFEYQDQAMDAPAMRRMLASRDPVAAFCDEPRLWGEIAGAERLRSAIAQAYEQALPLIGA
jgi:D-arabinitol 4-dehydrogenase